MTLRHKKMTAGLIVLCMCFFSVLNVYGQLLHRTMTVEWEYDSKYVSMYTTDSKYNRTLSYFKSLSIDNMTTRDKLVALTLERGINMSEGVPQLLTHTPDGTTSKFGEWYSSSFEHGINYPLHHISYDSHNRDNIGLSLSISGDFLSYYTDVDNNKNGDTYMSCYIIIHKNYIIEDLLSCNTTAYITPTTPLSLYGSIYTCIDKYNRIIPVWLKYKPKREHSDL